MFPIPSCKFSQVCLISLISLRKYYKFCQRFTNNIEGTNKLNDDFYSMSVISRHFKDAQMPAVAKTLIFSSWPDNKAHGHTCKVPRVNVSSLQLQISLNLQTCSCLIAWLEFSLPFQHPTRECSVILWELQYLCSILNYVVSKPNLNYRKLYAIILFIQP